MELKHQQREPPTLLFHNSIGDTTFVAAKQASGDINGTTHFRVEAGTVSGPPDSIHLSARHIGTFPVYSLHHILHLPTSLSSPSISLAVFFFLLTRAYKNLCACLSQAHPSDLSEGDFMGFSLY